MLSNYIGKYNDIIVRGLKNYYKPRKGLAPRILFSGGQGNFTEAWEESEAVIFARRAEELGMSREAILVETASSNTGENIKNSHRLLKEKGLLPKRIILVQKPFMERRYHTIMAKTKYANDFSAVQDNSYIHKAVARRNR